jgi:hypothetical protein
MRDIAMFPNRTKRTELTLAPGQTTSIFKKKDWKAKFRQG